MNSEGSRSSPSGGASTGLANRCVTYFVDRARQVNGTSPPKRVIGTLAKELGSLVKEGHSEDLLLTGIDIMVDKGLDPTQISSCVFTAQARLKGGITREDQQLLSAFITKLRADHGVSWPTGSRWVQSLAAGHFVKDPFGVDKPTYSVPWSPPTKHELLNALRERKANDPPAGTAADRPSRPDNPTAGVPEGR